MNTEEILAKYGKKLESNIKTDIMPSDYSREYTKFKREMLPQLSSYEKWCQTLGSIITIKVAKKDIERIQKHIDIAHLEVNSSQVLTLALISFLGTFFIGLFLTIAIYLITGETLFSLFFIFLLASLFLFYYFYSMPSRLAQKWRLKASSQMVPAILYIVIYMKHTSNLERAIYFASQHLSPPLALDFKKIFWDVETSKFSTIKESLDFYLETWRDYNVEFIESFHLIESSLFEPSESHRVNILEKALSVMLDGIYDKMLRYSREVRSPLTNIYMLGIVLPTLGLALIPLASTLLGGMISWHHIFIIFNLIIPFFVLYMTSEVLLKRPGGYGETELLELNPDYGKFKSKKPYLKAFLICLPFFILGLLPFIFQYTPLPALLGLKSDYSLDEFGLEFLKDMKLFGFIEKDGSYVGPFGILSLLLSLFIPIGMAFFFATAYKLKTKELIKARNNTKQIEKEFQSSLFQLGNRLGEGTPAEIAFAKLSDSVRGTATEGFFKIVNTNIQQIGMSVENAIFDKKRGAIIFYPSTLIATSMKILVESAKKGLEVAARSLIAISEYAKNIERINERLRDLLAEVSSDMKSNMTFLAPLLAGIVVGLTAMITAILSRLETMFQMGGEAEIAGTSLSTITNLFDLKQMIPPYFLQIAIGIYLVEIIFILTSTLVTVDSGEDKLKSVHETGKNLTRGILLYTIVALVSIISLFILAGIALGGMA